VITGVGVISPVGIGKDEFWDNLFKGDSGIGPTSLFNEPNLNVTIAGEITDFDARKFLGNKGLRDFNRTTRLLCSAAKLAIDDSRLGINDKNNKGIGISIGSTFGSIHSISKCDKESIIQGPRLVNPSLFPNTVANSAAGRLAIYFNIKGFNSTISTGMCSGIDAIDYAVNAIRFEKAKVVVTGAMEELSAEIFLGFYKLDCLAGTKDSKPPISCPFDRRRNGVILGEGAVVFILEDLVSAEDREANIYAEIKGIGSYFDPYRLIKYNPKGTGMHRAMELVLEDAEIEPEDIDYICANANSRQDADLIETKAIKEVFGKYAYKVPVSSIKSALGETYSASGAFGVAASLGAMKKDLLPPTINYKEKDPECNLDYVFNKTRRKKVNNILINTFDFNGSNSSIIISKV